VEDFLLALIKLFSLALTLRRYEQILVEIALFDTVGSLWAQIFRGRGSFNELWRQKARLPGLSRGVVSVILRLAVLIQYGRVTHTHTHRQTDTRSWLLPARVKTLSQRCDV